VLSDDYCSLVSKFVSVFGCVNKHDDDDDNDDKFTVKSFAGAFKQTRCRLGEVYV